MDDLYPEKRGFDEDLEKITEKNLRNRTRMANRETENPIVAFFKSILVRFGCSDA